MRKIFKLMSKYGKIEGKGECCHLQRARRKYFVILAFGEENVGVGPDSPRRGWLGHPNTESFPMHAQS